MNTDAGRPSTGAIDSKSDSSTGGTDQSTARVTGPRIGLWLGALSLAIGSLVSFLGGTPALLVITVLVLGILLLATRVSWTLAVSVSIVAILWAHTLFSRVVLVLGADYGFAGILVLLLAGVGIVVALFRTGEGLRVQASRGSIVTAVSALVFPVLSGLMVFGALLVGRPSYSWAMSNDMVWNTVVARFVLVDGGIGSNEHPNSSPLMNALSASWMAPGRDGATELLRHDIARQTELWLFIILLASALAGLLVARAIPVTRPALRIFGGLLGSAIPLTWYAVGETLQLGFLNVMPAVMLLLVAWLIWTELPARPVLAVSTLLFMTSLFLAAWAPLAVVSIALAAAGALPRWRSFLALRGGSALLFWGAAAQLVVYAFVVTLPDLSREGTALAANGAVPELTSKDALFGAVILFVVAVFSAIGLAQRHELVGVIAVFVATAIGLAFLFGQRWGFGALWGYYPVKFAWLLGIFFTVLTAAFVLGWLRHNGARGLLAGAVVVACLLLTVIGLRAIPLKTGISGVFPLVSIANSELNGAGADRADRLFRLADDGSKTILSRTGQPWDAMFINSWLLQLQNESSKDPVRIYSYILDPDNSVMLCETVEAWGGGVVIETSDPGLEAELHAECPTSDFSVRLVDKAS